MWGGDVDDGDEERVHWGFEGNAKIMLTLVCSGSVFSLSSIWSLEHDDGERAPCNRLGDGWLFLLARDICFLGAERDCSPQSTAFSVQVRGGNCVVDDRLVVSLSSDRWKACLRLERWFQITYISSGSISASVNSISPFLFLWVLNFDFPTQEYHGAIEAMFR